MFMLENIKGKVRYNERLKEHTSFKIGGVVKFFIQPKDLVDLKTALAGLKENNVRPYIIGNGSNILAFDRRLDLGVINLNSAYFKRIRKDGNKIIAAAGVSLKDLLSFSKNKSLSGLEFLAGIPGSLGGALIMNAGSYGQSIGNLVCRIKVIDYNNRIKILKRKDLHFKYRSSSFKDCVILEAHLKLSKARKKDIADKIKEHLVLRFKSQDYRYPSCGCFFKNPKGNSAGRLIDLCGLKGRQIGGAAISDRHANFIINVRHAKSDDVLKLMSLAIKKVRDRFNINLEPEVKILQGE